MPHTTHTPTGAYPAPAPAQFVDLEAIADQLLERLPGKTRQGETVARQGEVSVVMMAIEGGGALQEHKAAGPVVVRVFRGHAVVSVAGQTFDLREGELVMLEAGIPHDLRAEEQSVVLLTISNVPS
jgi:quercetin dioxygenase-like cupin family protein